ERVAPPRAGRARCRPAPTRVPPARVRRRQPRDVAGGGCRDGCDSGLLAPPPRAGGRGARQPHPSHVAPPGPPCGGPQRPPAVRAVAAGDAEWRSVPCVHAVLEGGTGGVEPAARAARAYRVADIRRRARRGAVGCARLAATPGLGRPLLGPAVPGSLDAG